MVNACHSGVDGDDDVNIYKTNLVKEIHKHKPSNSLIRPHTECQPTLEVPGQGLVAVERGDICIVRLVRLPVAGYQLPEAAIEDGSV